MRSMAAIAALALSAALTACGGGGGDDVATAEATNVAATAAKPKRTTKLTLRASDYGQVLFDSKGGALYLFTRDGKGKSRCYGDCAEAWPPFYARGNLLAGQGARPELLGRTTRTGGRSQVTYAGHPLYYYEHDPPNQILCHDVFEFGGDWLVVKASGKPAA